MSKYLLISLDTCWADEFDVNGLWVTTQDEYDVFLKRLNEVNFKNQEIYFGTNEAVEYSSKEDFLSDIFVTEVSESFHDEFYSIFQSYTYGMIDIPYLLEIFEGEEGWDDGEGDEF